MTETYEEFKQALKGRPNVPWAAFWWVLFLCFSLFSFAQIFYWISIGESETHRTSSPFRYSAWGLEQYHIDQGVFPPAVLTDENGNSLHSWRTLIMPHTFGSELFEQLDLQEPWDSSYNLAPIEKSNAATHAFYGRSSSVRMLAVVGTQTMWPPNTSISKIQITDGPEHTIQLIEVADSKVPWYETVDVHFDGADFTLRGKLIEWPQEVHIGYPYWFWQEPVPYTFVTFADGSVDRVPANVPSELLLAALTPAGGEPNTLNSYLREHPVPLYGGPNGLLMVGFPFLAATMFVLAFCYTFPWDGLRYTLFFSLGLALMMLPISGSFVPAVQGVQTSPGAVLFGALFWIVIGLTGGGCFYLYNRARQYIRWMNRRQSKDDGPRSQLEDTL